MYVTMSWTSTTALLHIVVPAMVLAQDPELTSTLHLAEAGEHSLYYAYTGEIVTFTCVVRGSNSMAWSSDEYIGTDRLEFSSLVHEGTTRMPPVDNGGTIAEFVNSFVDRTVTVVVSKLHITIQSSNRTSSIVCHNLGNESSSSISFDVTGNISLTCNEMEVCPRELVTCTCTTAHSNTLVWIGGQFFEDRIEFSSNDNVTKIEAKGNASAVLVHNSAKNGVRVMKANLTYSASESHTNNLTCKNAGEDITVNITVRMAAQCTFPTKASTVTTINEDTDTTSSDIGPGKDNMEWLCYIIISITILLYIVVIIAIIILCCLHRTRIKQFIKSGTSKDADGDGNSNKETSKGSISTSHKGSEQPTGGSNGEDQRSDNSLHDVVVTGQMLESKLTDMEKKFMSQLESQQAEAKERADDLRADYQEIQKEIQERDKQFKELKVENEREIKRMVKCMEEVKGEKQRQLEEMEEKLKTERTERQSQFDEMNKQLTKLKNEVEILEKTCKQLRELEQEKQREVENLEQELENTKRSLKELRDSMKEDEQGNNSGMEIRQRKTNLRRRRGDSDDSLSKGKKMSTQSDIYTSNFMNEMILKLEDKGIKTLKNGKMIPPELVEMIQQKETTLLQYEQ